MRDVYVQVLLDALAAGTPTDEVLANLTKTLAVRGHERLHASILQAVLRELTASRSNRTMVRVAQAADATTYKTAIATALSELACEEEPQVVIDNTLIGGYQLEANYTRRDASYKTSLTNLYRNITK